MDIDRISETSAMQTASTQWHHPETGVELKSSVSLG